jgi:poly(3-hydroxybutyrate) depolymerase
MTLIKHRSNLGAALFAVLFCLPSLGQSLPCGMSPCDTGITTTTWNGITRYYDGYFPPNISASSPYPIFVFLNGADVHDYNTPKLDQQSVLQEFAVANNVAVLWVLSTCEQELIPLALCNSPLIPGQWTWEINFFDSFFGYSSDDLDYINNMISTATSSWGADKSRVMLLGLSTGGIEVHRFAQSHPSAVLGIGVWAGPLWAQNGRSIPSNPAGSTNVFIQHGDADTTLPYCGGLTSQPWVGLSSISSASMDATFNYWASGMSCASTFPNRSLCTAGSPSGVLDKVATGCVGGATVVFMDDPGATHATIGPTYQGLSSFWNFLFPNNPARLQPTTTVVSNLNPSTVAQSVTFTATVASAGGSPTGTVTVMQNGTNVVGTVPLGSGQASLSTTYQTPGTRSITAVYSGDNNFAGSTSAPLNLVVVSQSATATTLSSLPNPSAVGQSVTFTATVTPQSGGTPTGTVGFVRNGYTLATVALTGGQATFSKVFNNSGTKSLSAVYSGDTNFASSVGSLTQTVK